MTDDEVKKIDEAIENEDWKQVWELSDLVESYDEEDSDGWGNPTGHGFKIDVRFYETPKYGKYYIARIYDESDEDTYDEDTGKYEPVYVDEYDYDSVIDSHKEEIGKFVDNYVHEQIDWMKEWHNRSRFGKFIGTKEQVDAIIDEEIENEIRHYVGSYSLAFYYSTHTHDEEIDFLAGEMEGSDVDDKIKALFDKTQTDWDDDEEEEN